MKLNKPVVKIIVKKVKAIKKNKLEPIQIIVEWKPKAIYI